MSIYQQTEMPDAVLEKEICLNFLQNFTDEFGIKKYLQILQNIANRELKILAIELDDLKEFEGASKGFLTNIQRNTVRYVRHFENAADSLLSYSVTEKRFDADVFDILQNQRLNQLREAGNADAVSADTPGSLVRRFEVFIIPFSSTIAKKLREIKADDIGHLVQIKGMVTRASDVKPRVTVCTYTCEVCGSEIFQEILGTSFMPIQQCPSQRCTDNKSGGRVLMQTRGSRFIKYQELRVQELPDQVPVGHIPRCMTIHCRGEQTRQCGPGDIVTVSGIFLTVKYGGFQAIRAGLQADTYIDAHLITKQKLGYSDLNMDKDDTDLVKEIAKDLDPYGRLASSIAPEIFGHEDVKKALLLQLVGGCTRELPDGMKIRGDINICLMGDPGVAKSQLLKYIATVAPRGVYTTGKGSSGVGLTAAIVRDPTTGDLALEGGALVLADMGVCCIDEFDKMDESDRTAIHEVMEQQSISIAKAGITTTLNARAAVLAAANPLYGRYNVRKSISENVDLPNSLLSRFDLLFLILDRADTEKDLALSRHVLHVHRYMKNPKQVTTPLPPSAFKRYIAAARTINPTIPKELTSYIVEQYVEMRNNDIFGSKLGGTAAGRFANNATTNQAVMTARQLLSILRLSQALARLRLSPLVSNDDVEEAIRLTYSSKASLLDDGYGTGRTTHVDDIMSNIFTIVKDFVDQRGLNEVSYVVIEAMITRRGFSSANLDRCLKDYQELGVISVDTDGSVIHFI